MCMPYLAICFLARLAQVILRQASRLAHQSDELLLQEFLKTGAKVRIMPPWSEAELEHARSRIFPHLSPASVQASYEAWGGNPRTCLQLLQYSTTEKLMAAVIRLDVENALEMLKYEGTEPVREAYP